MGNFQKNIFDQKLRIMKFDLEANQRKEFKEFCEFHTKNGTDRGSYFFNLRSELKGKHFRSSLDIIIECLINTFPQNTTIDKSDKEEIEKIFNSYSSRIIESEKNGLISVLASRGLQKGSSVVTDSIKAFENQLNKVKLYSRDVLHSSIISHNENVLLNDKKIDDLNSKTLSRTDNILFKIKNHRYISILLVSGIILIALGQVTDSFKIIKEFFFPNTTAVLQEKDSLSILIKVYNEFNKDFELNPLSEYEIVESEGAIMKVLSHGRLHLFPSKGNSDDDFILKPKTTKEYTVTFPNPKMYSTILDRGSANIHFILRSSDLSKFFICSAPFDRISLRKYFLECKLDSTEVDN